MASAGCGTQKGIYTKKWNSKTIRKTGLRYGITTMAKRDGKPAMKPITLLVPGRSGTETEKYSQKVNGKTAKKWLCNWNGILGGQKFQTMAIGKVILLGITKPDLHTLQTVTNKAIQNQYLT